MTKRTSYSPADLDAVSDNPEWTAETSRRAKSFDETFPDLAQHRGVRDAPAKAEITLQLDQRVIDHFKASGDGWRARMNDVLKKAAGLDR